MSTFFSADLDASSRMLSWNYSGQECRHALSQGRMLHLLAETTNRCDFDCEYCYTVLATATDEEVSHVARLPGELGLSERLALIDAAVALGAKSYDIVGAGEPLLDPFCLERIEHAAKRGMRTTLFTNGSILGSKIKGQRVAEKLWGLGATVVVKHHGPPDVHDQIVRKKGAAERCDRALALLMSLGFNQTFPTRLGIDNIIYQATLSEIPESLRWCRENNVYLVCSSFIPSGRTRKATEQAATWLELQEVFEACRRIDAEEFGIHHSGKMPFIGSGCSCTQYLGLYVTILGDVHGCVGKMETYGNIRTRTLGSIWEERLPMLREAFDGGRSPRQRFYESLGMRSEKPGGLF